MRTIPGLDCLFRLRLDHSSVLGFRWSFGHDVASASAACCVSADGQLVLVGPSNELARLMVVEVGLCHAYGWVTRWEPRGFMGAGLGVLCVDLDPPS